MSGADPDGLCFYCGVWVDEVFCDVYGVSVPDSVIPKYDSPYLDCAGLVCLSEFFFL